MFDSFHPSRILQMKTRKGQEMRTIKANNPVEKQTTNTTIWMKHSKEFRTYQDNIKALIRIEENPLQRAYFHKLLDSYKQSK